MTTTAADPLAQVLDAIERATGRAPKREGDHWRCHCPAHDDRNPSLSVAIGSDGRVLLCCQAKCPTEQIVAKLGLRLADLFPPRDGYHGNGHRNGNGAKTHKRYPTFEAATKAGESITGGTFVKEWHYNKDKDGNEGFHIVRFKLANGDKTCRPFVIVKGAWEMHDPPGLLPLLNLPDLSEGDPVYVVEGEPCVDAATSIGLTSTTSAHGASSADKSDWRPLAGRDVVILPDNDPAGDKYAAEVVGLLAALDPSPRVKIVKLPGLPKGGDIVQFLEAGGTAEQIERLAESAPPAEAEPTTAPSEPAAPFVESLVIPAGEFFTAHPEERRYVIENLIRIGEVATLVAAPKTYKSFLALCIVLCVVARRMLFGMFATKGGRALLIDNELHPETLGPRIPKVAAALGLMKEEWADRLDVVSIRGQLMNINQLMILLRTVERGKYDLIVLDALYRLYPEAFDENSNAAMTWLYNQLDLIAEITGATVLVVHHSSKYTQSDKSVTDTGSGAGAMSRASDAHIVLRPHEQEGCAVLEAVLRSSAPIAPLPLRWTYPKWEPAPELDPTQLQRPKKSSAKRAAAEAEPTPQAPEPTLDDVVKCVTDAPHTIDWIIEAARKSGFRNMAEIRRLLTVAVEDRRVFVIPNKDRRSPQKFSSREPQLADLADTTKGGTS